MKLIIQIPCYNEEATLPITLQALPKNVPGVDELEVLVIDDGSTDRTVEVARAHGVNHIVRLTKNKGLAEGFMVGLDACLKLGADIIVNTDADNQYCAADIETLIRPILEGKAEMVIGDRQINGLAHVPFVKKKLQLLGSWVVGQVSGTSIPDATSGFRAMSRDAALRLNVVSNFTYTLETIIQAGKKNIALAHVPVRTNSTLRESRLFKSIWAYVRKSMGTIFRIYTMYEPLRMFLYIGSAVFGVGVLIGLRFLYFYLFAGKGSGHIQSLILAAILIIVGFQVFMIGLLADLIGANRRLIEEVLYRIKKTELIVSGRK
ncbi:MAG: glycosyltransferase family 2 protein [bacterium]|nr:glycosyltransferase family 2 protein [candidate division KSB1 bacterium]MDH7559941.1 glycosyltransferase family 2 protein [bacterium]